MNLMNSTPTHRPSELPSFSVIINTDGRATTLRETLTSLLHLDYPKFEVCVVVGPTLDGTNEIVAGYGHRFKVGRCPTRNLSRSRNIGIAMASGDVVAFLDDDAVAEPEWLRDLAVAYSDPQVGGAGGFVYDSTGIAFQSRYVTVDRLACPNASWSRPAPELNFPYTNEFPHLLGTNASFRRSALLDIRGFDEEFEYFLDETDLCCRLVDCGYRIVQLDNAFVHHKLAESMLRDANKIMRMWYPIIKNRLYFALRNGRHHHAFDECLKAASKDVEGFSQAIEDGRSIGIYDEDDHVRFVAEAAQAVRDGIARGLHGERRLLTSALMAEHNAPYRPFSSLNSGGGRNTFCFVSRDFTLQQDSESALSIYRTARNLGEAGHNVHIIAKSDDLSRVEFRDHIWLHRLVPTHFDPPSRDTIHPELVPQHAWNWSNTAYACVGDISEKRRIDAVYAPAMDGESIAFARGKAYPLVASLQDSIYHRLESRGELALSGN